MMNELDTYKILVDIQLEQFWPKLRDDLQITRLSHFDHAKAKDFEKIGMSKPAIRRLIYHVHHLKTTSNTIYQSKQVLIVNDSDLKISHNKPDKFYLKNPSSPQKQAVSIRKTSIKLNKLILNDLSNLTQLSHKNLVKFIGIKISSDNQFSIISEYLSSLTLREFLINKRDNFSITLLHSFACQACHGMEFLESNKMIHKSLSLENIYIFSNDKVKIGQLESISTLNNLEDSYIIENIPKNLENYYPPETLNTKKFTIKTNVWLFGIILWELFMFGDHWMEIHSTLIEKPSSCSQEMFFIIKKCFSYYSNQRPYFKDLINLMKNCTPISSKAKMSYNKMGKLEIERHDIITIIDGFSNRYWYKGQNNRTLKIGYFPRDVLNPERKLTGEDISLPFTKSFIHTGHISQDIQNFWGSLDKIDPDSFIEQETHDEKLINFNSDILFERPLLEKENSEEDTYETINSVTGDFQNLSVIDDDALYSKPKPRINYYNSNFDNILNCTLNEIIGNLNNQSIKMPSNESICYFNGLRVRDDD